MSDKIRKEIERVDADLRASIATLHQQAAVKLSQDIQAVVDEASRQRSALVRKLFEATLSATLGAVEPQSTTLLVPPQNASGTEIAPERRTAREVVLDVLRHAEKPVRGLDLTGAVVREGLTQSAGEKVRRRMVAAGVIRPEDGGFVLVEGRGDDG